MNWYLKVLKNYVQFSGRARRAEYWWFVLFNFLATLALIILDAVTGLLGQAGLGLFSGIYTLAVFLPSLAVIIRRLHDTGRSGWWFLICLVPLVGGIILFVFLLLDSQPDTNQYGPNPKNEVA